MRAPGATRPGRQRHLGERADRARAIAGSSIIDLSAAGAQPMVDAAARADDRLQRLHLQLRAAARRAGAATGTAFFSHSDTEVIGKAYAQWGIDCVQRFKGMFAFAIVERDSGRLVLARDRLGIKPLYLDQTRDAAALRVDACRRCSPPAASTPRIDTVALSYYMSFHSVVPAPRTILNGVRKLPPATVRVVEPDGTSRPTRCYWDPPFTRDASRADWTERDWQDALVDSLRTAVAAPHGRRRAGRRAAVRRHRLEPRRRAARRGRARPACRRSASASTRPAANPATSSSTPTSWPQRFGTDHHRIKIDSARLLPAIDGAVAAMSEPMVSHDCVAFYLLSQEVAKSVKVVQSGQGADEILGGYDWYPPLADVPRGDAVDAYAKVFFDRPFGELGRRCSNPDWLHRPRRAARVHQPSSSAAPAPRRRSTPRCATTPRSCSSTIRSSASTT